MLVFVVGVLMTRWMSRGEVRRTLRSTGPPAQKAQRLRASRQVPARLTLVLGVAAVVELLLELPPLRDAWWLTAVGVLLAFRLAAVATWADVVFPADLVPIMRAECVQVAPRHAWLALVGWLVAEHADARTVALAFAAYVVLTNLLAPLLLRAAVHTRGVTGAERARVDAVTGPHRLDVPAVRVVVDRAGGAANALVAGLGPGGIFVTERLLHTFDDDELAAVLAHEVGHRRGHHVALKVVARLVVVLATVAAGLGLLHGRAGSGPAGALAVLLLVLVAVPLLRLVVLGALSLRLEHAADGFAVRCVGPDAVVRMLERLAVEHEPPLDRGPVASLRVGHPSIRSRLERVQAVHDVRS